MLKEVLAQLDRNQVVNDCVRTLEAEVESKKGLSGLAVKGAFKVISAVKPGFVKAVVAGLLDEFVEELEPFYADWSATGEESFGSYLEGADHKVANALLGVTDKRAIKTEHVAAKKAYDKLRPSGVEHVRAAMPRVGKLLDQYLS